MSLSFLSSKAIWLQVKKLFLVAHITLCKYGCMQLREEGKTASAEILSASTQYNWFLTCWNYCGFLFYLLDCKPLNSCNTHSFHSARSHLHDTNCLTLVAQKMWKSRNGGLKLLYVLVRLLHCWPCFFCHHDQSVVWIILTDTKTTLVWFALVLLFLVTPNTTLLPF